MDLLQSVVEIVMYGDRQDPQIFEYGSVSFLCRFYNCDGLKMFFRCFMERQVLADFVHILKISEDSKIQAPLLQAISSKINRDTLCLLVDIQGDAVVSFPLYTGALRFAQHEEKMIQTAIRALVLNIYNVSDDKVYQFISTPPVSEYFSDLICRLKDLCFRLDAFVNDKDRKMDTQKRRNGIILESEKIADELYYFKDILSVGEPRLTRLGGSLQFVNAWEFDSSEGSDLSAITSLYIISRLLQVVGGRSTINNVAFVLLNHILNFNVKSLSEGNTSDFHYDIAIFSKCLNEVEKVISSASESNGSQSINGTYLAPDIRRKHLLRQIINVFRSGHVPVYLNLDCDLSLMSKLSEMGDQMTNGTTSRTVDGSIFVKFMPEILKALLNVLAFQQPFSTMMLWHAGWCLQKLLVFHKMELDSDNLLLFTVKSWENSVIRESRESVGGLWKESCELVRRRVILWRTLVFWFLLVVVELSAQ
ncbi:hypothetical protein V8G54_029251 [Vigna mungo]|uniref:FPL domain-containing protein n=1 Tax=Vigna mungo TaxID=3915 RepID=A0AAQ3MTX2_VIGMU